MYGRGTADMKSGVATMAYAMKLLKDADVKLKGNLVYAGVIDEDAAGSEGTRYIVRNGPLTDLAIVGEPTSLQPVVAHKGCDYLRLLFMDNPFIPVCHGTEPMPTMQQQNSYAGWKMK